MRNNPVQKTGAALRPLVRAAAADDRKNRIPETGARTRQSSLITGLLSYWKLEEASGTRLDSVGPHNLLETGTIGTAAGKVNQCATFPGTANNRLKVLNHANLKGNQSFTVAAWVYLASITGTFYYIMGKTDFGTGQQDWMASYRSDSARFRFYLMGNSEYQVIATNFGAPAATTWYHLVCWHDLPSKTVGISVNAGTANTTVYTNATTDKTCDMILGDFGSDRFSGRLDEFGFWSRALTAAERTALYNGGAGVTHPF